MARYSYKQLKDAVTYGKSRSERVKAMSAIEAYKPKPTGPRGRITAEDMERATIDEKIFDDLVRGSAKGELIIMTREASRARAAAAAAQAKLRTTEKNVARRKKEAGKKGAKARLNIGKEGKVKRRVSAAAQLSEAEDIVRKRKTRGTGLSIGR